MKRVKKFGEDIHLFDNGYILNTSTQHYYKAPNCLLGQTTKKGNLYFDKFSDFEKPLQQAAIAVYCTEIKQKGKTVYAECIDQNLEKLQFIKEGWRKVNGSWVSFNESFKPGLNFLLLRKNDDYPNNLQVLGVIN